MVLIDHELYFTIRIGHNIKVLASTIINNNIAMY